MSDQMPDKAHIEEAPAVSEHPLLTAVRAGVPGLEDLSVSEARGMTELRVGDPGRIVDVCRFLKMSPEHEFVMLLDMVGIDYWDGEPRYGLAYNLHSLTTNQRLIVKVRVSSGEPILPTLTVLWAGANWMEREVFDMFGIRFQGHPDLRKILTPDDLEGHPQRKDFPLGNVDIWPDGAEQKWAI